MKRFAAFILLIAACAPTAVSEPETGSFVVEQVGTFIEPTRLVSNGDTLWVVERSGRIISLEGEVLVDLDFDLEDAHQAKGLLGLAFGHGRFWVYFADPADNTSAIYEFADGAATIEEGYQVRLWGSAPDHYGGHLIYRDGWLYVSVGDGAQGPDDPRAMSAQLRTPERGAILRWNTDPRQDIWETIAKGLRNPYTWTIHDGWMYIGDVGRGEWEEINVAPLESNPNFGWPIYEGSRCLTDEMVCNAVPNTPAALQYYHGDERCGAVIVGDVYEGGWLDGALLYADFCNAWLEAAWFENGELVETRSWPGDVFGVFVTAVTVNGNDVYVAVREGSVYRVSP